ncbi:MAG: CBS domain-containing protein [Chlorobiaceae bacterium]
MLLSECIDQCLDAAYPVFQDSISVKEALALMRQERLSCAPVVHEGELKAMVTPFDLLSQEQKRGKKELCLGDLRLEKAAAIGLHEHTFDIFRRMHSFPGSFIPVVDDTGQYAGVVRKSMLSESIAEVFHLGDEGMTIEIDVPSFGLKLSEVIAAFEKNDATVLSFGLSPKPSGGTGPVETFRVQTHDPFRLIKNMENYGYSIRYSSPFSSEGEDDLRERALEFIRLMDM